jgi:potassium channel subfamily K
MAMIILRSPNTQNTATTMRRLLELQTLMSLIHFLALSRLGTGFTPPGGRHRWQPPTNTVCARQHPQTNPWRRSTSNAYRPTTDFITTLDGVADRSHGRLVSLQASNEVAPERRNKDDDDPSFDQDAKDPGFSLAARFLESFWKGITLPFPLLRTIILHPDFNNTNTNKKKSLNVGLTFREGLSILAVYLAVGVLSYHLVLEKWSIIDSLYFTCTCFSTVGYGDLCPTTPASKLFTCAFGLGGIALLGGALATVGGRFVQAEIETAKKAREKSRTRLMQLFEGMPNTVSRFRSQPHEEQEELLKKGQQKFTRRFARSQNIFRVAKLTFLRALPSLTIILGGGAIMRELNGGGPWIDAFYFSLMTASTIGFGDISPKTPAARLFAVFFIPLSVAAAGELLSGVALAISRRRQKAVYEKQLESDLTIAHLQAMDSDGDGKITREEYVDFMLIEMGRVSKDELDVLSTQFDRLDVTRSGYLDRNDLKLMAKLRGAKVKG